MMYSAGQWYCMYSLLLRISCLFVSVCCWVHLDTGGSSLPHLVPSSSNSFQVVLACSSFFLILVCMHFFTLGMFNNLSHFVNISCKDSNSNTFNLCFPYTNIAHRGIHIPYSYIRNSHWQPLQKNKCSWKLFCTFSQNLLTAMKNELLCSHFNDLLISLFAFYFFLRGCILGPSGLSFVYITHIDEKYLIIVKLEMTGQI